MDIRERAIAIADYDLHSNGRGTRADVDIHEFTTFVTIVLYTYTEPSLWSAKQEHNLSIVNTRPNYQPMVQFRHHGNDNSSEGAVFVS